MTIGKKIKATRLKLLLTQKQMAQELGVSVMSVIRWENERHVPSFSAQRMFKDYCKKNKIRIEEE